MAKPLVIVESPAKAKTLGRFLGTKYRVEASYGHIRDLPESAAEVPKEIKEKEWGRLGVDVDSDFTPVLRRPRPTRRSRSRTSRRRSRTPPSCCWPPTRTAKASRSAGTCAQVLKPKIPVRRIVFHEITEDAVARRSSTRPRSNENLVRAQESRRILDRLYGYTLSPVLWKKVQTGLSAGRVQSVAVRLIVEREEERRAFRTGRLLGPRSQAARARAASSSRRWRGSTTSASRPARTSTPQTGALKNQNVRLLDEAAATALVEAVRAERAVAGHVGRAEARRRTSGAALHDLDAHAGGQPQARVLHRAHDADRAAAVPGHRDRRRRDGRPDHLSPHRLDHALGQGAQRVGARHQARCSAASTTTARAATRRA